MVKKNICYLAILLISVFLDQISKFLIVANIPLNNEIVLLNGFFSLHYVQNTGAGFSILEGQFNLFYILTVLAVIMLAYFYFKAKDDEKVLKVSLMFMIGGALGNFIDRLRLRYVIDFLDFDIFGYDFPIFNIADSFLTIGVILFILAYLFEIKELKWKK